jgi:hypothetical protein
MSKKRRKKKHTNQQEVQAATTVSTAETKVVVIEEDGPVLPKHQRRMWTAADSLKPGPRVMDQFVAGEEEAIEIIHAYAFRPVCAVVVMETA